MGHIVHVRDSINLWPKKLSRNHHCSRWISTCGYYFTSPQLLTRMGFFFTNTSPQASHVWRPSLHIDCQGKWKIFCYMKLNYMLIQNINLTHSFIKLYNEILLAHKISDKYLTMLDIDLIKSNEILVFCNKT